MNKTILVSLICIFTFSLLSTKIHAVTEELYFNDVAITTNIQYVWHKTKFQIKLSKLADKPADEHILMPVPDISVNQIEDTWQAPRSDRRVHEGQDIFAEKGTPIFAATNGYVIAVAERELGGNIIYIFGAGGRRYYYAHLDSIAPGIRRGDEVTTDTLLGFVGNTGNALNTPYHLHFGVYDSSGAINPLPLLKNRV